MNYHIVDIAGFEAQLPIMPLPSGISIAFLIYMGTAPLPNIAQNN